MTLRWTETGDNQPPGRPVSYKVIASNAPIVDASQPSTVYILSSGTAGATETLTYTGLAHGSLYYFAVVAIDVDANASLLSNQVSIRS